MDRKAKELLKSVVYSIALEKTWLKPAEKIYALQSAGLWEAARSRDQVDLMMAAGCYEEAIPLYAAFSHWRKVGDALFALGRLDEAKCEYEKGPNETGGDYKAFRNGPDRDRLIALAAARGDWTEALNQVRAGSPEPVFGKDVVFDGSSRAKTPLMKLFAHAAAKAGAQSAREEMQKFFGLAPDEADLFLDHARSDAYAKDATKLAKPPLTRIPVRSLKTMLEDGNTERSREAVLLLSDLDATLASAIVDMSRWKSTRSPEALDRIVYWLTRSGSYEIFKSCLFALQCEHPTYGKAEEWEVEFYTAHPWLTRGGMRELLKALVASDSPPSPQVLLCCAFQHSYSPFDFSNIDVDYTDPLTQIRAQPAWAEAVIGKWQLGTDFWQQWSDFRDAGCSTGYGDLRQTAPFKTMAESMSAALQTAWKQEFEKIRWKTEHGAFLALKALLPDVRIVQHASPIWLAPQHLDIYLPNQKLAIEYQGEQHYRPIEIFGGPEAFEATVRRDETKRRLCALAGVRLEYIHFEEDLDARLRQIAETVAANGG
ncbi:hypothetical protein I5E68_01460 [Novosphingobium sp. YJ-S2-02]|uniref:Uncharacterized protein n=1 Tax=Novosphingobium aureum TaxID=2792964 RepID=A0A931H9S2_9SPHN|nr:hypothetical protein [Novosphingobium aureum]MBH0111618.1 hypothetical protein [Novosphingobium aureum]